MPARTEIVITGIGQCSSLADNVQEYWSALVDGRSGMQPLNVAKPMGKGLGAALPNGGGDEQMPQRLAQAIDSSVSEALSDARLTGHAELKRQIAVVAGSNFSDVYHWCTEGDFFHPMREAIAENQLGGEFWGISTACASGVGILGLAGELIRFEGVPIVLACAYDGIYGYNYEGLASLRALSSDQIRPFDERRSGTLLGEGAGVIVLEERRHAEARGARIYAEMIGYGIANDAHHFTAPEPSGVGMRNAMSQVLAEAGIAPEDVDHLNAHGTGTPHNDRIETSAVHAIFGESAPTMPITSLKPAIGHCMGAAGILEVIAAIFSLRDQVVPPTLNSSVRAPECDLDYVFEKHRPAKMSTVMSNSYGLWGCNASVALRKVDDDGVATAPRIEERN